MKEAAREAEEETRKLDAKIKEQEAKQREVDRVL
jgi:hypothetical protein